MHYVIAIIIIIIIIGFISRSKKRLLNDRDRMELTAEHQRIQRETPEHPDAVLGTEEFILAGVRKREKERSLAPLFIATAIVFSVIILFSVVYG